MTQQLALGVKLRDSSVFESFFAQGNDKLVEVLRQVTPGEAPTCIFLQGAESSGKTHLLQALCVAAGHRHLAVAYLPLRELATLGPEVMSGCGELDCVCVDDVERIAGQANWERALFALHQRLDERQGRLIVSSTFAPAATGIALADLRSRLGGGLILTLQPLDEQGMIGALQLRARMRGFDLPLDVAQFLLRRLPRDMRSLCDFLDCLDEASLVAQRRLTVPFVRDVVEGKVTK